MEKLKEMREKRKLTQEELAELMEVDRTTVTKWETGTNSPSAKTLLKLVKVLDCKIGDILCP